jgi:hypothetical protein
MWIPSVTRTNALPVSQVQESGGSMTVGDKVEVAGLAVALVVGFPAAVAAVIAIGAYVRSGRPHRAGKP